MPHGFWRDARVLVTGYEGFLGSHLVSRLVSFGARVVGLDIKTHRRQTILTGDELRRIRITKGSVENYNFFLKVLKERRVEYVFHLAATSTVGEALKFPARAFSTNIRGTWNVLEASRNTHGIKAVIVASSDKAYGFHRKLPYSEDAPLCGEHPYDVSKSCADLLAHTYYRTYGLPVCITRCGNVYGPGDFNFSRIVPDTLRCAFSGKTLNIRSDGTFIRDYVYVSDIIEGYLILAEKLHSLKLAGEAFNFSNESPLTVIELVKKIYKIVGVKEDYRICNQASHEILRQFLASGKARRVLGWRPRVSIAQGLGLTAAWYKDIFPLP